MKDDQGGGGEAWGEGPAAPAAAVNRCNKCLSYVRAATSFTFSHIGLVSLVVGYTQLGALAFQQLEKGHEVERAYMMRQMRETMVETLWNFTLDQSVFNKSNWTDQATKSIVDFENKLVKVMHENGTDENEVQWTYSGALLYSIIVITTIGYGNVAPKTNWGKIVTVLYAVVGIPLMLLCMSNIGDTLAQSFKFVYWKVCCYFCVQSKNNQRTLNRARSLRYNRYGSSTRSRGANATGAGGGGGTGSHLGPASASRHSSTRSGATLQGEGGSEAGSGESSGFYSGRGHDMDMLTDDVTMGNDAYPSRRRHQLPTTQQPQAFNAAPPLSKDSELNKVPIILNKYILESKEDLRVDLPPSTPKEHLTNSLTPTSTDIERHGHLRNLSRLSSRQRKQLHRIHMSHRGGGGGGNGLEVYNESDIDLELEEELEEMSALEEVMDKGHVTVPIWVCCALVGSYICGGAAIFTMYEGWGFLDSSYFCFVTLSTIGFGDLVPGKTVGGDNAGTLALCAIYLLFGMALLAMSFNLVQEQVTSAVKCIGKRMGIIDDDEDEDEDNE